jgi:LacI family transcriptional regulator
MTLRVDLKSVAVSEVVSHSSKITGVVVPPRFRVGIRLQDWSEGFGYRIVAGIAQFLGEEGSWEVDYDHRHCGDLWSTPITEDWTGDGLLVFRHTAREAEAWRKKGIRVLNLSAELPGGVAFPRLTLDNGAVAERAVEYLAGLGLRQLAYWHDPCRAYSLERLHGFEVAAAAAGCDVRTLVAPIGGLSPARKVKVIEKTVIPQLLALPRPCGLLAKDDVAGLAVLRLCRKLGIRCPEDLAVLAVNDDPAHCQLSWPALSSIRFPGRRFGYLAARLLHELMTGEREDGPWRELVQPGPVVPRLSSGRIEFPDPAVGPAMTVIAREAPLRPLSVIEVCHEVGVSRELLRSRMQALIGRTPKQEIDRVRLAALEAKLAFTDLTLAMIADEMKFYGADDLSRFYRRLRGRAPGQFRARQAGDHG